MNVWATISEGKPSPRTEIVYNVEPFRGAVRQGDWKLIWRRSCPPSVELFNLAKDPSEKTTSPTNPDKVKQLQARIVELAKQAEPPLFLTELVRLGLIAAPDFPDVGQLND